MERKIILKINNIMACITLFSALALSFSALSQQPLPQQAVATPTAANLGLFDNIPVSHFTGTPNISVPIYEINYRDLTVPVSLNYHPAGIKPDQPSGWVGLGWNLMAGGSITREIRGWDDEHDLYGFFKKYSILNASDWSSSDKLKSYANSSDDKYQDIFRFSMNGYSGEIVMSHTGTWVVISDHNIKVEFDQLTDIMNYNGNKMIKQFRLITDDGTKYTFGGSIDFIEYSYRYIGSTSLRAVATTWQLSKIESQRTNAVINFVYARGTGGIFFEGDLVCLLTMSSARGRSTATTEPPLPVSCSNWFFNYYITSFELQSPLYLSEISYSDIKLKFYRSKSNALFYAQSEISGELNLLGANVPDNIRHFQSNPEKVVPAKLDSISILYNNNYVKSYQLQYNNNQISHLKRLALTQVKEKTKGSQFKSPYDFEYFNLNNLPNVLNTYKVDHWGYYNNRYADPTSIGTTGYYSSREPENIYSYYGIISKVTFPTRGSVILTWENNDYNISVPIIRTNPLTIHATKVLAGGPRIKRMTFFDPITNGTIEKNYYYVKGYTSGANVESLQSSGVLNGQSQYKWDGFRALNYSGSGYATLTYDFQSTNNLIPMFSYLNGSHVSYSEVVEKTGDGNGYTIYKYSNYDNGHGDDPYVNTLNIDVSAYTKYSSKSNERGKLLGEFVYDNLSNPIKATEYEYFDPTNQSPFVRFIDLDFKTICSNGSVVMVTAYKKYSYKYLLHKKIEKVYQNINKISSTEINYNYNNQYQLREQTTNYHSRGETSIVKFKYVSDFNLNFCNQEYLECRDDCLQNSGDRFELADCYNGCSVQQANCESAISNSPTLKPIQQMRIKHIVGMPIETTEFIVVNGTQKVVKSEFRQFKVNPSNQLIQLDKYYVLNVSPNLPQSFTESNINQNTYQITSDPNYRLINTFLNYDNFGNPTEVSSVVGLNKVWIYGYDARFPLLEVNNSTYSAVITALGSNYNVLISPAVTEEQVRTISQSLRSSLPQAQIQCYTFNPVFGLTSQTDLNGDTQFYAYDDYGRLRFVKDGLGNMRSHYSYHYMQN